MAWGWRSPQAFQALDLCQALVVEEQEAVLVMEVQGRREQEQLEQEYLEQDHLEQDQLEQELLELDQLVQDQM